MAFGWPTHPMILRVVAGLSIAFLAVGCGHEGGALDPSGFRQDTYGYRVSYADAKLQSFLGADWLLDNYYPSERTGKLVAKGGDAYVATREFDADGNGQIEAGERSREDIYDLRFTNTHDDGVIWLKAHPLLASEAQRDLEVMVSDYADGLAGEGLYAQSNLFSIERSRARRFVTFVVDRTPIKVGPLQGLSATIEVAEAEKLKLDPAHRDSKIQIVFAPLNFYTSKRARDGNWPVVDVDGKQRHKRPGLFVAGYVDSAARFTDHLAEFAALLQRITFTSDYVVPDAPPVLPKPDTPGPPDAGSPATPL